MCQKTSLCIAGILFLAHACTLADDWMGPTEKTIASPSGRYRAIINPASDGKSGARATLFEKDNPNHSFALKNPSMPVDVLLLDNGMLITFDQWGSMGFEQVVIAYDHTGRVLWSKTLEQILGRSIVDKVPRSVSSLWWRKTPLEVSLTNQGKNLTVTLWDEHSVELSLSDGSAAIVLRPNVPNDPVRLFNRAQALVVEGKPDEAIAIFERAIQKDPDYLNAFLELAKALQRKNDHGRVVLLLGEGSKRWGQKHPDKTNLANVYIAWSESLAALKLLDEAESAARLACNAAPTYSLPALNLARILLDRGKSHDADIVLNDLFDQTLKATPVLAANASMEIGDFYKERKQLQKALDSYRKSYRKDQVTNQFLYASLAKVLETLGNNTEAIQVNEQLLSYFDKMGPAFADYANRTRQELERLHAKPMVKP